jgi:two-component system, NtrC family, response regulator HydG
VKIFSTDLNVVEIELPPLRDRRDDIPLLVRHFSARAAANQNLPQKPIDEAAFSVLKNYDWPGNVRELENTMERAFVLSRDEITLDDLPQKLRLNAEAGPIERGTLDQVEKQYIMDVMESVDKDKVAAAKKLGIDLSTLYRKLKRYEDI